LTIDLKTEHAILQEAPCINEVYYKNRQAGIGYCGRPIVGNLGETLFVLQFHEAYHAGQTGLLRRMAGREGVIK
jgi:hypothetical protein